MYDSEEIEYYIFELNFGDNYVDGCITDKNGDNVKLQTVHNLWNLLINNYLNDKKNKFRESE